MGAVDVLGSPVMSVEEIHHVQAGADHEENKHQIPNHYHTHKHP